MGILSLLVIVGFGLIYILMRKYSRDVRITSNNITGLTASVISLQLQICDLQNTPESTSLKAQLEGFLKYK